MIRTSEFSLTRAEHFREMLTVYLRRSIWLWLLLMLCGIVMLWRALVEQARSSAKIGYALLMISFPELVVLRLWLLVSDKRNAIIYRPHYVECDDTFVSTHAPDGTGGRWRLQDVQRVKTTSASYVLFLTKEAYLIVPFRAFVSPEGRAQFEALLRAKGLLKTRG